MNTPSDHFVWEILKRRFDTLTLAYNKIGEELARYELIYQEPPQEKKERHLKVGRACLAAEERLQAFEHRLLYSWESTEKKAAAKQVPEEGPPNSNTP